MDALILNPFFSIDHQSHTLPSAKKPVLQKITDLTKSIFKELLWLMKMCYRKTFSKPRSEFVECSKPIDWKVNSQGLYVLVHGLRGHPAHWIEQLKILEKEQTSFDVIAPFVPKQGDCTLEDAAQPILEKICEYTKKNPTKPVSLIGVSNGGRIVTWLESELREKAPNTPVKVSAVAGVHFGSRLVTKARHWPIAKQIVGSKAIQEELAYGSPKAFELAERLKNGTRFHNDARSFDFYATAEDLCVDVDSALPSVANAQHYLVHGEGHNTIVEAVASHQIQSCQAWMSKF